MILPYQKLLEISTGASPMIRGLVDPKKQIQMATTDCSLHGPVYRMKAAAVPSRVETVAELIERFASYDFAIRDDGSVLERGGCYLIPLNEEISFTEHFSAVFSPKSSIGRTDTFVRVLCDRSPQYDRTDAGYRGKLYLEITPLSFNVAVRPNLELTQFRVRRGECVMKGEDLALMHARYGLMYSRDGKVLGQEDMEIFSNSLFFHIDLDRDIVGLEARANPTEILDLSNVGMYDPEDFWIPIKRPRNKEIVLTPGKFYLLTTKERVRIPPEWCAEIVPYDVSTGEFRSHYAGFFDNGFGGKQGTHVVLEVRARDVPHRLYDGQRVCRMVFERTLEVPEKLYGTGAGSHYIGAGPSLPKHFKERDTFWS